MGLKNITENELKKDLERHLREVITDDNYLKVKTGVGNAVIISETEWNMLRESVELALKNK